MRENITSSIKVNPGANSSVVLYDDLNIPDDQSVRVRRIISVAFLDQDFAIRTWWAKDKVLTTPLRLVETATYTAGVLGHIAPVRATRPVTVVAVANLVDNDYFTLVMTETRDGVAVSTTTRIFEYKVTAGFAATAGRYTVDVSGVDTDVEVAVATAAKVQEIFTPTVITCAVPVAATFTPTSYHSGTSYVISGTENVADAGFTIDAATAGVDGTIVQHSCVRMPGRTRVVLDTATAPVEFDVRVDTYDDAESGV